MVNRGDIALCVFLVLMAAGVVYFDASMDTARDRQSALVVTLLSWAMCAVLYLLADRQVFFHADSALTL